MDLIDNEDKAKGKIVNFCHNYYADITRFEFLMTKFSKAKDPLIKDWILSELKEHPFFKEYVDYDIFSRGFNDLAADKYTQIYVDIETVLIPELKKLLNDGN